MVEHLIICWHMIRRLFNALKIIKKETISKPNAQLILNTKSVLCFLAPFSYDCRINYMIKSNTLNRKIVSKLKKNNANFFSVFFC